MKGLHNLLPVGLLVVVLPLVRVFLAPGKHPINQASKFVGCGRDGQACQSFCVRATSCNRAWSLAITPEILKELLKDDEKPNGLMGKDSILKQLTTA